MKQDACDPQPRMISEEAVPFLAYATQLFIGSLTYLAWNLSTVRGKRNTLQVKDLQAAILSSPHFDFLIDVVDTYEETRPAT